MCLSSIWKYFLVGIFMIIYIAQDSGIVPFALSNIMQYVAIGVISIIIFGIVFLLVESRS
jgi:hypothetical protein